MSENLNVHATLTAADTASPIIRGLLANLKKLEDAAKRLNTSFNGIGNAGFASMAGFDRATQAATSTMNGFTTANRAASRSVSEGWRRATEKRLRDAQSIYGSLSSMEASYQRQMERRLNHWRWRRTILMASRVALVQQRFWLPKRRTPPRRGRMTGPWRGRGYVSGIIQGRKRRLMPTAPPFWRG